MSVEVQGLDAMRTLRDVDGVLGSFLVTEEGAIILRDCPPIFDDVALAEAGARLVRLREAIEVAGDEVEHCVLDYVEHKLFVRTMKKDLLVVIAPRAVNLPALRMGASLVVRRLERLGLDAARPSVAPALAPEAIPRVAPPTESTPPPAPPGRPEATAARVAPPPLPEATAARVAPPPLPEASKPPSVPEPASRARFFRGVRVS